MATVKRRSPIRAVLLVCLVLHWCAAVCNGRVLQDEDSGLRVHHPSSSSRADGEPRGDRQPPWTDAADSSAARHWRLLSRRLSSMLRLMRSRQSQLSPNDAPSSDVTQSRARRASGTEDKLALEQAIVDDVHQVEEMYGPRKIAQQREVAREIEQIERDAGAPSDDEKLALEEEIAREVKQIEEQYGPAHKIAQQKEIARQIEEAEIEAGRAVADRRFEQQREIQREMEEIERKAGVPTDAEKLEREREIARIIEAIEAQVRARQSAQERNVAADIRAAFNARSGRDRRPGSPSVNDGTSSSASSESNESGHVTDSATDNVTDDVEDDPVYDDAFADSALSSPLDENNGDDDLITSDSSSPAGGVASGDPAQVKDAPAAAGGAATAHSSWQVTLMTVIMCSIVGVIMLIVVGTWYRDLGFRSFRPGRPEELLLDDDEQTVYNRTTQPQPRQVGTYSPLT